MTTNELVLVFAFDPVLELGGQMGILCLPRAQADRLVAEHLLEETAPHVSIPMRYVPGSPAFAAAREALRQAREGAAPRPRAAKVAKGA